MPAVGRFISVDPVYGGSATAYDYANADPVNGLDLTGERFCNCGGGGPVKRERRDLRRSNKKGVMVVRMRGKNALERFLNRPNFVKK